MNIFVTDYDPVVAAQNLCDCHVVKMCLESAQMLSTVLHKTGVWKGWMYKPTHAHHPCTVWAGTSDDNFYWLLTHALAIGQEYHRRYEKIHKSDLVTKQIAMVFSSQLLKFDRYGLIPPVKCMPDRFKVEATSPWAGAVESYRNYYRWKAETLKRFNYTERRRPAWL